MPKTAYNWHAVLMTVYRGMQCLWQLLDCLHSLWKLIADMQCLWQLLDCMQFFWKLITGMQCLWKLLTACMQFYKVYPVYPVWAAHKNFAVLVYIWFWCTLYHWPNKNNKDIHMFDEVKLICQGLLCLQFQDSILSICIYILVGSKQVLKFWGEQK